MNNAGWGDYQAEVKVEAASEETEEAFRARRDAAILGWREDKQQATFWKQRETASRATVSSILFPNPVKGTQRYDLGAGYKVKLVFGFNYTLGIKDMPNPLEPGETISIEKQAEDLQEAIRQVGNEGPFLADRLIKWKPELSATEYEALDPDNPNHMKIKALIDAIMTKKPASPQLELEEPKASQ